MIEREVAGVPVRRTVTGKGLEAKIHEPWAV